MNEQRCAKSTRYGKLKNRKYKIRSKEWLYNLYQEIPVLEKQPIFTIELFKQIKEVYPESKLYFIGFEQEFGYFEKMKKLAADYCIQDDIFQRRFCQKNQFLQ